jgi:hypothetical protein
MLRIGQAHHQGAPPWTIERMSRELSLPGIAVADVVENLELSNLLSISDDGKLFPARETSRIDLEQVIDSARARGIGRLPQAPVSAPAVQQLQQSIETAWRKACKGRTLADLVAERA